jgi:hypothetical protein
MNPAKFWQVVSNHKWIPTVILWEAFRAEKWDPSIIGYALLPETIEREIGYIAFRPWHTLELSSVDSKVEVEVKCESGQAKIQYVVFFHISGEFEFTRCVPIDDKSIRDTIMSIHPQADIDAVVRISTITTNVKPDFSNAKTNKDVVNAFVSTFTGNVKERYEIFRPTHTSGHHVTE